MSDRYCTIEEPARAEQTVEESRFFAEAMPVDNRGEVTARIETIRDREHKATHYCMGYRLGEEGDDSRYNDDGEPSGTAGPRFFVRSKRGTSRIRSWW